MLEPLREIPGPVFLLVFTVAWILSMVVAYLWIRFDGTQRLPVPYWYNYDPIMVAYIRGGAKAVAETVLFSLAERGIIVFEGTDSKGYDLISRTYQRKLMLNKVELEIYKACPVGTSVQSVRDGSVLHGVLVHLHAFGNRRGDREQSVAFVSRRAQREIGRAGHRDRRRGPGPGVSNEHVADAKFARARNEREYR